MRKQTKLVAVASAAALLAIGASMTSFAATGWVEEGGEWFYYEKDGSKAEDTWKKSGDKWFWLDSEESGAMAIDKLVEDGDNTYYVDSTGAMVSNTWVKVVNEDQDDEDDPAEYNYYYMQSNGKAYKGNGNSVGFKTIDGKRYSFDEDGKMLYGWVDGTGARLSGEDDWTQTGDVYYCGSWDDGAMKTGWQKIYVHDNEEDEDMDHWFFFNSNGKRFFNNDEVKNGNVREKKVNGKTYGFDDRGVMVYEWALATSTNSASVSDWKHFSSPEDGARKTKGWFKVIAPDEDSTFNSNTFSGTFASTDADDETERWYYADGSGDLYYGAIKKIKGKYYGFRPDDGKKGGAMLSGLVLMKVETDGTISDILDDGVDADDLSDILDGNTSVPAGYSLYFFGNDADSDGALKTGSTTVVLDGDSYNFYFSKSGGVEGKGKGVSGIDDNKYIYMYGCRLKADSDDKYQLVKVTGTDKGIGSSTAIVSKKDSRDIRTSNTLISSTTDQNRDDEYVLYADDTAFTDMYLVNSSGSIVKSKTAAKDGADWYFYVNNYVIKMYTNNKTLPDSIKTWK